MTSFKGGSIHMQFSLTEQKICDNYV